MIISINRGVDFKIGSEPTHYYILFYLYLSNIVCKRTLFSHGL